jgi:hypothetical protein
VAAVPGDVSPTPQKKKNNARAVRETRKKQRERIEILEFFMRLWFYRGFLNAFMFQVAHSPFISNTRPRNVDNAEP